MPAPIQYHTTVFDIAPFQSLEVHTQQNIDDTQQLRVKDFLITQGPYTMTD